ncbi:MAG: restriction endonuclease subunit S [Candidatus Ozemobacteraceae bacterium]
MVNWESTTIGELLEFKNGLNKGKEFFGKGTPIVNYMDVYKHRGIHAEQLRGRVTLSTEEIRRFDVHKGDVFFTRTSETPEEVGYAGVMLDEIDDCVFSGFVLRGRPTTDKLDIGYCQYAFMTEEIRKAIMSGCTYTTRALTNGRQLSAIEILLPDKDEQRLIAEALTDTDALLAAMEKLIAKKRSIKQGAMQELLTGKQRLPGFEGEWAERPLGDFGYCVRGVSYSPDADLFSFGNRNAIVLLRANNIVDGKLEFDNVQFVRKSIVSEEQTLAVGDIVIAMSSGSVIAIGKTGTYIGYSEPCCIGAFCAIFRSEYNEYIRFLFQSPMYREQLQTVLEGTSINNLNGKIVEGLIFTFPSDTREIDAIAEILSDMDAEIDTLKAKLNKLRNIKQGMMSELLTGRIRLADSQAAIATVVSYPEQEAEPIRKVAEDTAPKGHNQQFDDAVMIAGIVNAFYSNKYPLGRKKVQKCLYLLRRYQDESTEAFKKKAAGPYADEVRYKGGEPIAKCANYIATTTGRQGTTFARGKDIGKALDYIQSWGREADIKWVADKLKFKSVDELELLATVDMAICDLTEAGTPVSVQSIKHLIATNAEWKEKLKKQTFSDANIARAIRELNTLLQGGN